MTPSDDDFEDLFDNAPCGYLSLLPNGQIAMANNRIAAWTGIGREQLAGKRIHDILPFSTRIYFETNILPLLRMQGSISEVVLDLTTADGTKFPTLATLTERRDANGQHLSTRIILLKVVDRRQYERELVSARDEAKDAVAREREASELREQFIAVLGHDLRNPLAAIASGVHLLANEPISDRGKYVLRLMEGSVVRASALIDNVLDFARGRLGGGLTLLRQKNAPLEDILIQITTELQSIAPDRVIETQFAIDRPVNCDPTRIGQLASNLLGNALTHGAKNEAVRIGCTTGSDGLTLWVANGGVPIPPKTLTTLFQPFFRGAQGKTHEGLGLGLYIASQIAEAHGGELLATSSADETRFTFAMPLSPAE